MDKQMLQQYARFAVRRGVALQKGQTLLLNAPIECAEFARMCATEAYDAGARDVVIHYQDEQFTRIRMDRADAAVLEDVKGWLVRSYMDYAESEGGACRLAISARDPEIFKGLDVEKIEKATQAQMRALKPLRELTMSNRMQWSILSVPTVGWAKKVFPNETPADAVEKLWTAIFHVCRMDTPDPSAAWDAHVNAVQTRLERLNAEPLTALHLRAANGTDLTVGLPEGYLFTGIGDRSTSGVTFFANVPSEEVFTAPHCRKVSGLVKSSLPYVYNGNLIVGITARFEDGVAVEVHAEQGDDLLQQMLSADEGARRLGEIALVPASSPIQQTGLLFYNTLYDENAACHMAFGASYPTSIQGGANLSRQELDAKGMNDSLIHEDIMIGTPDMDIDGILPDGTRFPIFRGGEWAF